MKLPKILATGKFRPDDLEVSVSESNRKINPAVEAQIEEVWETMRKKAVEAGKVCYNGISYRLNSVRQTENKLKLDFATFEYKVRAGLISIPEYFDLSEEYYRKGCFSGASIKTSDERYLMAELSGKSMNQNSLDLIGGVMETNIEMNTGHDIFTSLYNELEEEAGIKEKDIDKKESYLQTIYLAHGTNVGFYFEIILNISSIELLKRFEENKDTDIKSLRVYTREEYINTLKQHQSLNKQLVGKILCI